MKFEIVALLLQLCLVHGAVQKYGPCIAKQDEILETGDQTTLLPICDVDGTFDAVQFDHSNLCWCVNIHTNAKIPGTTKSCNGYDVDCLNAKSKCVKEREEAQASGAQYAPQCTSGGFYATKQCHATQCWCVEAEKGGEVPETRMNLEEFPINCDSLPTKCQMHNIKIKHGYMIGILATCDDNGDYDVKQCNNGICWCVDKTSGTQIIGTRMSKTGFNFDCTDSRTKCERESVDGFPACYNRFYRSKQCQGTDCWCVNKEFGNEIEGTRMLEDIHEIDCSKTITNCMKQRARALRRGHGQTEFRPPVCEADGSFQEIQCLGHIIGHSRCWCVDKQTGIKQRGSDAPPHVQLTCPDKRTACQRKRDMEQNQLQILDNRSNTVCDDQGNFQRKQCFRIQSDICWCVDPQTGKRISSVAAGRNC